MNALHYRLAAAGRNEALQRLLPARRAEAAMQAEIVAARIKGIAQERPD
jgi:hypothetical protein